MARDLFWMAALLGVMAIVTFNGLTYSTQWNPVQIGPPVDRVAPTAQTPSAVSADAPASVEAKPRQDKSVNQDGDDEASPVTLAQSKQ